MLWEACLTRVQRHGGEVRLGRRVTDVRYDAERARWTVGHIGASGEREELDADHVVSSAPLREVMASLSPAPAPAVAAAAQALRYRDFLIVALVLRDRQRFDDNWIYVHDPTVKVGRIQNFKSWSPEMVPDASLTCYGLEYFCFEGDGLWESDDAALIDRAIDELERLGLAVRADLVEGSVVRQPKAYPVYDDAYATHVQTIREALADEYPNLHLVGRNGMHKYNNQDHAMMTALLTAENILAGTPLHDPWLVNEDAEYHEEQRPAGASGLRAVPRRVTSAAGHA
jgi:protoporphyrinogen oxidase